MAAGLGCKHMDIHSLYSARQLERHRGEKPLDAVIRVAKAEAQIDQPIAAEIKAKGKENAQAVMDATLAAAAAEVGRRKKVGNKRPKQPGDLGAGDSDGQGRAAAELSRYSDPKLFMSEVKMFGGRTGAGRRFPHDDDQSYLRRAEGASTRTTDLNCSLRAGRAARHSADLRLLRECETRWIDGRGKQPDGERMRLGRVGQVSSWRHSGFLHQRGRIMTWHWQRSYWVVNSGLLWCFNASHLGARASVVLPILGARLSKTPPSSRVHPYSFTVSVNPHFMADEKLGSTELAAASFAEREEWMHALNEAACEVSRLFRRAADHAAHEEVGNRVTQML